MRSFRVDRFRDDLLTAGFGSANHGVMLDTAGLGLLPHAILRVRVTARTFERNNNSHRVAEYIR